VKITGRGEEDTGGDSVHAEDGEEVAELRNDMWSEELWTDRYSEMASDT